MKFLLGNHDDLGLLATWGFGVGYLGLFGIWRELSGVIFPTSWNFLGNHDDNNRSGDTARVAGPHVRVACPFEGKSAV